MKRKSLLCMGSKVDVICSSTGKIAFTGILKRLTTNKQYAYLIGRFNTENFPKIRSTGRIEINVAIENLKLSSLTEPNIVAL